MSTSGIALILPPARIRDRHEELRQELEQRRDDPSFYTTIERFAGDVVRSGRLLNRQQERASAQGVLDFWSAVLYRIAGCRIESKLDHFDWSLAEEIPEERCPYPGLDYFHESQRENFCGREDVLAEAFRILESPESSHSLLIVGESASGKTSLVRAGMLPRLRDGDDSWKCVVPDVRAEDPLLTVANLLGHEEVPGRDDLIAELMRPGALRDKLSAPGERTMLILDQFESFLRIIDTLPDNVKAGIEQRVLELIDSSSQGLILCLKSEAEVMLNIMPAVHERLWRVRLRIPPLTPAELEEAITGPAAPIGLEFEDGLVEWLVRDTVGITDALPSLQFTLRRLWSMRQKNWIRLHHYEELGCVREAIDTICEQAYEELTDIETAVRNVFLRMIRYAPDGVQSRPLPTGEDTPAAEIRVIDVFARYGLMKVDQDTNSAILTHDCIGRTWKRLIRWMQNARDLQSAYWLAGDGEERWRSAGMTHKYLLAGKPLASVTHWLLDRPGNFRVPARVAGYVAVSRARARRRWYWRFFATLIASAALLVFVWYGVSFIWAESEAAKAADQNLDSLARAQHALKAWDLRNASAHDAVLSAYTTPLPMAWRKSNSRSPTLAIAAGGHTVAYSDCDDVSCTGGENVRLWRTDEPPRILSTVQLKGTAARRLAFARRDSADLVVIGTSSGLLQVVDMSGAEVFASDIGAGKPVTSIAISNDGSLILAATQDAKGPVAILFDVEGRRIREFGRDHRFSIASVAFAGQDIITAGRDGLLMRWDRFRGDRAARVNPEIGPLTQVSVSESTPALVAVSGTGSKAKIYNVETFTPVSEYTEADQQPISGVMFGNNGNLLAVASFSQLHLRIVGREDELLTLQPGGDKASLRAFAIAAGDSRTVTFSSNGLVDLWRTAPAQLPNTPVACNGSPTVAITADGNAMACGANNSNDTGATITLRRASASRSETATITLDAPVDGLAFLSDGRLLAVNRKGQATWLSGDLKLLNTLCLPAGADRFVRCGPEQKNGAAFRALAVSPQNSLVAISDTAGVVRVFDANSEPGKLRALSNPQQQAARPQSIYLHVVRDLQFSADGRHLGAVTLGGALLVWQTSDFALVRNVTAGKSYSLRSVAFAPSGDAIITGSGDGHIARWGITNPELDANIDQTDGDKVSDLAVADDRLWAASSDGHVRVYPLSRLFAGPYSFATDGIPTALAGANGRMLIGLEAGRGTGDAVGIYPTDTQGMAQALRKTVARLAGRPQGAASSIFRDLEPAQGTQLRNWIETIARDGSPGSPAAVAAATAFLNEVDLAYQHNPGVVVPAAYWNDFCWYGVTGSLGTAVDVTPACFAALYSAPSDWNVRQTVAVALAAAGRRSEALAYSDHASTSAAYRKIPLAGDGDLVLQLLQTLRRTNTPNPFLNSKTLIGLR